jgi:hypothetical protein
MYEQLVGTMKIVLTESGKKKRFTMTGLAYGIPNLDGKTVLSATYGPSMPRLITVKLVTKIWCIHEKLSKATSFPSIYYNDI